MSNRSSAYVAVHFAIKSGILLKPDECELCSNDKSIRIVAHHWNGHDNPLDVWFICDGCNQKLIGPEFHNGSITKEQARIIVTSPYLNGEPRSRLMALLNERGWSIYRLAQEIEMSYQAVYTLVTSPNIPEGTNWGTLTKVSSVLGVSIGDLDNR